MRTRRATGPAQFRDACNLPERQSKAASAPDEAQQVQDFAFINSISGSGPPRTRDDPAHFVQPKRLPRQTCLLGYFPDQKPVGHVSRIDLAS
jgi:hypothetical protein